MSSDMLTVSFVKGFQVLVDAVQDFAQVATFRFEPRLGGRFFHLHEQDAGIGGSGGLAEGIQPVLRGRVVRVRVVDEDYCAGAVHLGVHSLNGEGRVLCQLLALEDALFVFFLGLVADQQNDLVLYVDPRIVVIVIFVRGDSVSHEHHRRRDRAGR